MADRPLTASHRAVSIATYKQKIEQYEKTLKAARVSDDTAAINSAGAEIAIARRHLARLEHGTPAIQEPPRSRPPLPLESARGR
jgi:hypothetical protein